MLKIKYDLYETPEETVERWCNQMREEIKRCNRKQFAELAVVKRENEELKQRLMILERAICQK